jgi:hypothetical protein
MRSSGYQLQTTLARIVRLPGAKYNSFAEASAPPVARAEWIHTFPIGQQWRIFQMSAQGYPAFPVYALECFAMYVTGAWIFSQKHVAEKKDRE